MISTSGILIVQCRQSPGGFYSGAQCSSRIFLSDKQLSFSCFLCSVQLVLSQYSWNCLGTKLSVVLLRSCRDGATASTQTSPKLSVTTALWAEFASVTHRKNVDCSARAGFEKIHFQLQSDHFGFCLLPWVS